MDVRRDRRNVGYRPSARRGVRRAWRARRDQRARRAACRRPVAAELGGDTRRLRASTLAEPHAIGREAERGSSTSTGSCSSADPARRQLRPRLRPRPRRSQLSTMKLVGYTEVVHQLADRLAAGRLDPALRRARQGPAVSRLDDRHVRQRRRLDARPHARNRARAGPRERDPPRDRRRHPLLERQGRGARGCARAHADRRHVDDERHRRRVRLPAREPRR